MKTLRLFVVLAALVFAGVGAPSTARARDAASFDFFYDSLAPYGDWIQVGDYGPCWRPANVDPDWTPYSDGYWAYTDAGWTWVSYEDYGGIVYHYGRWMRLEDEGWCWVPDYEWGPAWVSWRSSDDYVGWAPLPPEARWQPEVGISIWADQAYDIGPGYYSFCHVRDFGAPVLRGVIIDRGENITILRGTVNITNITYNTGYGGGRIIYNGGPNFAAINRLAAHPVPALKLVQNANFDPARRGPGAANGFRAQTVGNQLIVAAPLLVAPGNRAALNVQTKRVVAAPRVTHGWAGVNDPGVQKELRQEISRQSKGLTPATAPARAVAAAELKGVPEKADPNAKVVGGERHDRPDRPGKTQRPENVVVQPNNPPPSGPAGGGTNLKPFNPTTETKQPQNPPAGTFTQPPRGANANVAAEQERAAEQARIREEQGRNAQQKQGEMAAERQKQIAAEQEAARGKTEDPRRREVPEQQRPPQPERKVQPERPDRPPQPERQPQTEQRTNNPPPASPHAGNGQKPKGKDDKDKDKDKNGN
ncbi:MAG: hypothetical protein P4L99_17300 [Chthoniobacter sp.]|nr:hypothetical protein [Chthoniobacter sp.]